MSSISRSLPLTMVLYFAGLGIVAGATYTGVSVLASAVQMHFLQNRDRPHSRLDLLVTDAREIRHALATPIAPVEPLPPITAKPLRDVAAKPGDKVPNTKLSAQARDESADRFGSHGSSEIAALDRHRPQ
jgi:hypothetical protein